MKILAFMKNGGCLMRNKLKLFLCIALGIYSLGVISYIAAEVFVADACVSCFKGEKPFAGGEGSTPANRNVDIKYNSGTQINPFNGADATRLESALSTAATDWNGATDGNGSFQPYNFRLNQDINVNLISIGVELVDEIPGEPSACASMSVVTNADGSIRKGFMRIKRSALANLTSAQMALLIEHELGHFIGLADNYDADHCGSIMSQAEDGCKPKADSIHSIDVEKVKKYVADSSKCSWKRGQKPLTITEPGATPTPTAPTPPGGGCTDQDHDGVCWPDDCDDYDPSVAYDSDGDHYCYPADCNDYDANIYPGAPLNYNTEGGEDRDCNGVDDYQQQFGTPGGGGGGGGGGYSCTPYYWVYYESYDGGQTWYVVDMSYAGCW